tara:strand:- start:281 stop:961 length:681 start_codon:yes stop_codon:yes gene_type:complete
MPKISIIIPAYNEEKYIKKTIDSIIKSDFKDYEIIIVLDSCTDNTSEVIKQYKDLKFITVNARKASVARNAGVKLAKSNILIFLDADTLIPKHLLSVIASEFEPYAIGTVKAEPDIKRLGEKIIVYGKDILIGAHIIKTSNGIIITNKSTFDLVGGFDNTKAYHEDGIFVRQASKLGKFLYINNQVVTNSMRRYEILGYLTPTLFWIKEFFKGLIGKRAKVYPAAR